jgi:MinD superfamily P-loop ATPase
MSELVVLSGKGGTGKTSLTAAFVDLIQDQSLPRQIILVDADVDAPNLDMFLSPKILQKERFWAGLTAEINLKSCRGCGTCNDVCRFDAVLNENGDFQIDPIKCEGCAACFYQCPESAITLQPNQAGEWFRSEIRGGMFFHAALEPAQENSGKLVALIKEQAREWFNYGEYALMLIDGPPGTGCPVIAAVSGADAALIVTEPSLAGIHDLQRALKTTLHFGIKTYVCINKSDLYPDGAVEINRICQEEEVLMLGKIPYDLAFPRAMVQGQPVTRVFPNSKAVKSIKAIWKILYQESLSWNQKPDKLIDIKNNNQHILYS